MLALVIKQSSGQRMEHKVIMYMIIVELPNKILIKTIGQQNMNL